MGLIEVGSGKRCHETEDVGVGKDESRADKQHADRIAGEFARPLADGHPKVGFGILGLRDSFLNLARLRLRRGYFVGEPLVDENAVAKFVSEEAGNQYIVGLSLGRLDAEEVLRERFEGGSETVTGEIASYGGPQGAVGIIENVARLHNHLALGQ